MRTALLTFAILAALLPNCASAWWDMGHMDVAALAYGRLTDPVRMKVDALIRRHPAYARWIKGSEHLPERELAHIAFVHAATWADDIKGELACHEPADTDCYKGGPDDPIDAPTASQNIGIADHLKHGYWHYYDLPFTSDGSPTKVAPPVNALSEIQVMTAALKDAGSSDDVKAYDLVWLLHLVGDAHQPLHAVSRFTHEIPGDEGGNKESLAIGELQPLVLHAFWDGLLGDRGTPAAAIAAASVLPQADPVLAANGDPADWFNESAALARQYAYTVEIGPGAGPFPVSVQYVNQAKEVAKQQVALAGVRLANLVNGALATRP